MHDTTETAGRPPAGPNRAARGPVLELRRYTLHPGRRDALIALFDREFVEPQEAVGMRVVGQFRDLDDPDRFVWIRAFADMPTRAEALAAFYGGPVWAAHRDAANATMIAWDDVLLLRPASADLDLTGPLASGRPAPGTGGDGPGLVAATILHLDPSGALDDLARLVETLARPATGAAGAAVLGPFVTEESPNTFRHLPVREGERVLVVLDRFPDVASHERQRAVLEADPAWCCGAAPALRRRLVREPEVLRLKPTARSLLHG